MIDRQLNASINLYLQMEELPPSPKLFKELMRRWSGFALTEEEAHEGSDELARSLKPVNPKRNIPIVTIRYVSQNPVPSNMFSKGKSHFIASVRDNAVTAPLGASFFIRQLNYKFSEAFIVLGV